MTPGEIILAAIGLVGIGVFAFGAFWVASGADHASALEYEAIVAGRNARAQAEAQRRTFAAELEMQRQSRSRQSNGLCLGDGAAVHGEAQ